MYVVNTPIADAWTFTDNGNTVVIGKINADFTKTAYLTSAPATTAAVTVAAVSGQSGDYSATFTPTAVGRWKLKVSCLHAGYTYRWEETFDVVTAAQADPLGASVAAYAEGTAGSMINNIDVAVSTRALAGSTVITTVPVASSGQVTIYQGDDYDSAETRSLLWELTGASSLVDAQAVTLLIRTGAVTVTQTVEEPGPATTPIRVTDPGEAAQIVAVDLTNADTTSLNPTRSGMYDLSAVLASGAEETLARGRVTVIADIIP